MIKVLHLISGDLWAGAEIMAYTLLSQLVNYTDLDLDVVVLNNGTLLKQLRHSDVRAQVVDEARLSFLGVLTQTSKVVRALRPDIIHSHRYKENILTYLSNLGCPGNRALVATQHGMPELFNGSFSMPHYAVLKFNRWLLAKRFRMTISVSEDIRESLIAEHGFSGTRLSKIHNGIEISQMSQERRNSSELRIGSSGRFFPVKDYLFLVEIAKEVSISKSNISFRIAGEGPQFNEVALKVKQYRLEDRVALSGFVSDMGNFYRSLDAYINTSIHEGIPMSVLEAMAYGLPVIAPRVGGLKEIITDGVEGFLIEDRNPGEFAKKCILLSMNDNLRTEMSLAARKKVISYFSAERMAKQYYELYKNLVST